MAGTKVPKEVLDTYFPNAEEVCEMEDELSDWQKFARAHPIFVWVAFWLFIVLLAYTLGWKGCLESDYSGLGIQ